MTKATMIREIEAVHRDLGYKRQGQPLSTFREDQLEAYLHRLKRTGGPWEKKTSSRRRAKAQRA